MPCSCKKCGCCSKKQTKWPESSSYTKKYWLSPDAQYLITTDASVIDLKKLHQYLSTEAYWSPGIPFELMQKAISNSVPFSVLARIDPKANQDATKNLIRITATDTSEDVTKVVKNSKFEFIGFARVVTDMSGFGYLADVFIDSQHRKKGIGKLLMSTILNFEDFKYFRRWSLATRDGHPFYKQFGFGPASERNMEIAKQPAETYQKFKDSPPIPSKL